VYNVVDNNICEEIQVEQAELKCEKSVVKVVRDILTKKWVFMKRNKQLRAMSPLPPL
jgi:hypothetical protein